MSYDFALERVCPHETVLEVVGIDPGGLTVQFPRPPSSLKVSVSIDGFDVPPAGLLSVASLPFGRPEPYRIRSGVNDLLYLRQGFGLPQLVPLIPGPAVKASDLAADLQRKVPNLRFKVVSKRVVVESHASVAGTAFSFQDPRWTDKTSSLPSTARILKAYSSLGIVPGRCVTGRKLFPGWIVEPPTSPVDTLQRQIRFEGPIFNHDPLIQLSYITTAAFCKRCQGTQIEFDYSIAGGTYETVTDVDLLSQEFDKFVFTRVGSHWKWPWLGSGLMNRIGGKGNSGAITMNATLNLDVDRAFRIYQNIKSQQDLRFPSQRVSDAEFPYAIGGIKVIVSPDDPTIAVITTEIVSRSRTPVELKRIVGNPSPVFALGSSNPFLLRG